MAGLEFVHGCLEPLCSNIRNVLNPLPSKKQKKRMKEQLIHDYSNNIIESNNNNNNNNNDNKTNNDNIDDKIKKIEQNARRISQSKFIYIEIENNDDSCEKWFKILKQIINNINELKNINQKYDFKRMIKSLSIDLYECIGDLKDACNVNIEDFESSFKAIKYIKNAYETSLSVFY